MLQRVVIQSAKQDAIVFFLTSFSLVKLCKTRKYAVLKNVSGFYVLREMGAAREKLFCYFSFAGLFLVIYLL